MIIYSKAKLYLKKGVAKWDKSIFGWLFGERRSNAAAITRITYMYMYFEIWEQSSVMLTNLF